jgi:hypothetical protein
VGPGDGPGDRCDGLAALPTQHHSLLPGGRPALDFGDRAGFSSSRATRSFRRPRRNPTCILLVQHFQLLISDTVLPQIRVQINRGRFKDKEDLLLCRLIDEEYTRRPFYGSRRMVVCLRRLGHIVNRKRVQRLMRTMGLAGMAPGPNTSGKHPKHKVYPYLLRGVCQCRS